MSTRFPARSRARWAATANAARCALAILPAIGCGDVSLDSRAPTGAEAATSTGDTLPPLDTGASSSTGDASTGEPTSTDDPRLCAAHCEIVLPTRWTYEATRPLFRSAPGTHVVPAMLRDADGTLTVAEQAADAARLHHLDAEGRLERSVVLPLPCDPCELTDVAPHPSGDLLLSATGVDAAGELGLLAMRYDVERNAAVWTSRKPLVALEGVHVRSGGIAALPNEIVAQLYMRGEIDFDVVQRTLVVAYGPDGTLIDEEELVSSSGTTVRPPLLARPTADGRLLVGVFGGVANQVYGMTDRIAPPLWHVGGFAYLPVALDDVVLDAYGHALEVGHAFDGTHAYLLLGRRAEVDVTPQWVAELSVASRSSDPAALAQGPDGDLYVALRSTQAPGDTPEPLVSLSLSRWTSEGELRWHTGLLQAVAESWRSVVLAVDHDDGLVIATVVDDGLRVERRAQRCACGS